jgi:sugar lactone lactonase YvrE
VPACNLPSVTALDASGTDNDLLDCLECQTEEGALSVLRTLYGATLCCVNGRCDTVRTRWACRAAGGAPAHYRIDTVDVGSVAGPHGIDVADDGTLYIADSGYARIKKRTPDGTVSVVGDTPSFPTGVAADAQGNVYVTNRCLHQLRKITPQGVSSVFAGTGVAGHSGDEGPAVDAQTAAVDGVTVDTAGNVYFTESGFMAYICGTSIVNGAERVRMVDTSGTIHTVAGSGNFNYDNPNGSALLAGMLVPYGLHVGPSGRAYIGEAAGERVFRLDPAAGSIAWIAGRPLGAIASFAGDSGPALRMRFYENCGADEDQDGNVIVGPMSNNRIVLVDALGSALVIAGTGAGYGTVEGSAATLTAAACPEDVAVAPDGKIYFSDLLSSTIKVLTRIPF